MALPKNKQHFIRKQLRPIGMQQPNAGLVVHEVHAIWPMLIMRIAKLPASVRGQLENVRRRLVVWMGLVQELAHPQAQCHLWVLALPLTIFLLPVIC